MKNKAYKRKRKIAALKVPANEATGEVEIELPEEKIRARNRRDLAYLLLSGAASLLLLTRRFGPGRGPQPPLIGNLLQAAAGRREI